MNIYKAENIKDAVNFIEKGLKPMAGCTNIFVDIKKKGEPGHDFVDISGIEELKRIEAKDGQTKIGALATFCEIEKYFSDKEGVLYEAARDMGSPQIRNRATVGGNICDASPACDAGPALLVLGAKVKTVSKSGERLINISDFFKGVRKTALENNEMVTEIVFKNDNGKSFFRKVGLRNALAISVVSLAGKIYDDGKILLAMGSVSSTPVRLYECEKLVNTGIVTEANLREALSKDISPITDLRASADYRFETAYNLLADALGKELCYEHN